MADEPCFRLPWSCESHALILYNECTRVQNPHYLIVCKAGKRIWHSKVIKQVSVISNSTVIIVTIHYAHRQAYGLQLRLLYSYSIIINTPAIIIAGVLIIIE